MYPKYDLFGLKKNKKKTDIFVKWVLFSGTVWIDFIMPNVKVDVQWKVPKKF